MNEAKPFVKWVGGKTQLLPAIETELPPNYNRGTYIEPFVGGGAMLFFMLQKYPNIINRAIINDINADLINAYRIIQERPNDLIEKLERIQSEYIKKSTDKRNEYYYNVRDKFNGHHISKLQRASYFIFILKTCYNGLWRVNSLGLLNTPAGRYANPKICDAETILKDSELLQRVEIINGDFADTLQYVTDDSFIYIDSPYKPLTETSAFTSYTKGGFDDKEQIRLKGFCDEIHNRGALFIESNSDTQQVGNPFFDVLYNEYNIIRVNAKRFINSDGNKRGDVSEILIKNF